MDGKQHISLASLTEDVPVITLNGLSKSHCLCGYRCGWMVISGPRELTEDYRQGIIQLTSLRLCANTMAQIVIPAALDDMETPASMVRPGGRIYEQREATVRELEKIDGLSFVKNDAAFYVFPKLDVKKFNITNDKQFAMICWMSPISCSFPEVDSTGKIRITSVSSCFRRQIS